MQTRAISATAVEPGPGPLAMGTAWRPLATLTVGMGDRTLTRLQLTSLEFGGCTVPAGRQ